MGDQIQEAQAVTATREPIDDAVEALTRLTLTARLLDAGVLQSLLKQAHEAAVRARHRQMGLVCMVLAQAEEVELLRGQCGDLRGQLAVAEARLAAK